MAVLLFLSKDLNKLNWRKAIGLISEDDAISV